MFGFRPPLNVIARAPKLQWIQAWLAGVNEFLTPDIVASNVIVTNGRGVHVIQITELVFEDMLMLAKMAPMYFRHQQEKKWERHSLGLLYGKTLGIIGLGHIGRGVARMGKAFGMKVVATKRKAKKVSRALNVDVLYPPSQLPDLLKESNFVVMALPFTPETDKIIGEKELHMMKPTAFLVNVGRGETIDENALIRALEKRSIAGAGLDAYTVEPLPSESKLWSLPNVVMTPHCSGMQCENIRRHTILLCENLKRFLDGKKLTNVVDKKRGY
jgi:phosphoglycerate dehydrogenase-like enzyme